MSSSCGSSNSDDDFVDAVDEFPPLNIPPSSYSEGASRETSDGTQQDIGQNTKNDEADAGSLDLDELIKGQTPISDKTQSLKKQASLNSPEVTNQRITDTGASTPSSQGAAAGDIVEKPVENKKDSLTMIMPPNYEAATLTDDLESKSSTSTVQPDIVASSILERPTNLPGIVSSTSTSHTFPSVVQTSVDQRPKRPPPPKPRHPPKRPPPVRKPVANTYDDGTLTPNTTVDNITRDFAEFSLQQQQHSTPSSSNKQTSEQAAAPDRYKPSHPCSQEQTRQESRRQTPSPTKHKKTSLTSTSSTFDEEILSTVIVRNLDTGQTMPLSAAAEQVSQYLNPLSLQIMSRTKEFNCPTSAGANASQTNEQATATSASTLTQQTTNKLQQQQTSSTLPSKLNNVQDEETVSLASDEVTIGGEMVASGNGGRGRSGKLRQKRKKLTSFISDKAKLMKNLSKTQVDRAVQKVRSSKVGGENSGRGGSESLNVSSDDDNYDQGNALKFKAASSNKGPYQFSKLKLVQDINVHVGAVWSMKFSHCGRLLATAGQNNIIWVWVLKDYYSFFNDLRSRYENKERGAVFATPPRSMTENSEHDKDEKSEDKRHPYHPHESEQHDEEEDAPFRSLPFTSYVGHTADVLDLAWSKNYFTLSSSMDKTVRLWHVSQKECLCCFQHIDFVTAIAFHPKDDRYFLSGSLDGKLRLWNIPEKKVALWNEVTPDSSASNETVCLITSVNFCENGKYAVCGTYDGRCLFFNTEHLKYWTQIHVRSSRRRAQGHKITGIEPLPSEHKVLITSNDSRVRLYDLRDLTLSCKYKGLTNTSSQIKASFSHDCKYIICGSEDKSLYVWPTHLSQDVTKISSLRRDRNEMWESIRSHDAVVTCAIFAPYPHLVSNSSSWKNNESSTPQRRHVIISADFDGVIKVFMTG